MPTATRRKACLEFFEPVPRRPDGSGFDRGSRVGLIDFMFNPKEYSASMQADWKVEAKKGAVEAPEYTGCKPMTMDLEMFLDGGGTDPGPVIDAIKQLIASVRPTSGSRDHPCPPLAIFSWESATPFECVVKSVAASVTMFTPDGRPLRATCRIGLLEYVTKPAGTNPTSGAERSVKARPIALGDTLASIAYEELGDPSTWRAIALTNGIDDPFTLVVGRELLIPARADVARLT